MIEINGRLFDWDTDKNIANIQKHGVSFKMAATAFLDPMSVTFADVRHSQYEDRFILIGINKHDALLTVCHCYRSGHVTRIISARAANQEEKNIYGGDVV